ncbi:MAG TPA: hypothetical protein VE825_12940 [Terriglobales bacterium]|nr:hypothetical protein [Terriglobales bacterium]
MSRMLLLLCLAVRLDSAAQQAVTPPAAAKAAQEAPAPDDPEANPGRPTVSTPATLTPVGYFQFETGYLGAWNSPEFSSQSSINEVIKLSVHRRIELLAESQPFAHSRAGGHATNDPGDVFLGVQGVVYPGEGARPTVAVSYFGRVYAGTAPGLDIGSARNSVLLLVSADVKGFHYDTNYFFDEAVAGQIRRAQFGQTLSVSHALKGKFGLTGEIWHFTQPFQRGHAVGNLWAVTYDASKDLVFDAGFDHGLTGTSTRWEVFAGFTYLLPHRALRRR